MLESCRAIDSPAVALSKHIIKKFEKHIPAETQSKSKRKRWRIPFPKSNAASLLWTSGAVADIMKSGIKDNPQPIGPPQAPNQLLNSEPIAAADDVKFEAPDQFSNSEPVAAADDVKVGESTDAEVKKAPRIHFEDQPRPSDVKRQQNAALAKPKVIRNHKLSSGTRKWYWKIDGLEYPDSLFFVPMAPIEEKSIVSMAENGVVIQKESQSTDTADVEEIELVRKYESERMELQLRVRSFSLDGLGHFNRLGYFVETNDNNVQ